MLGICSDNEDCLENEYCHKHHENESKKHAICKGKSNKWNFTTRNMNILAKQFYSIN